MSGRRKNTLLATSSPTLGSSSPSSSSSTVPAVTGAGVPLAAAVGPDPAPVTVPLLSVGGMSSIVLPAPISSSTTSPSFAHSAPVVSVSLTSASSSALGSGVVGGLSGAGVMSTPASRGADVVSPFDPAVMVSEFRLLMAEERKRHDEVSRRHQDELRRREAESRRREEERKVQFEEALRVLLEESRSQREMMTALRNI